MVKDGLNILVRSKCPFTNADLRKVLTFCFMINSRRSFGLIPAGPFLKPMREQTRLFSRTVLTWGEVDPLQSLQFY